MGVADRYAFQEPRGVPRQLSASTDDLGVHVDGKTDMIRRILEQAGLADHELDEIEGVNRI